MIWTDDSSDGADGRNGVTGRAGGRTSGMEGKGDSEAEVAEIPTLGLPDSRLLGSELNWMETKAGTEKTGAG